MAGVVHIPWYATGFRADRFELALADVSAAALRYNARSHAVYRYRDDRYKFLQTAEFEDKHDFERYWYGHEMTDLRVLCSGWYQIPVLYGWTDLVVAGTLDAEPVHSATAPPGAGGNGDLVG
jgi:hypothetical protein